MLPVEFSLQQKIHEGCQMIFTPGQKISYCTGIAIAALAGGAAGSLLLTSTFAITLGCTLGASASLIAIIYHRTVLVDQAEKDFDSNQQAGTMQEYYSQLKIIADRGYAPAEFKYGESINDPNLRLEYYKRAADRGHKEAQFQLGNILQKGKPDEAFRYIKLAADQMHADAVLMVGEMYFQGKGTAKDLDAAIKYLQQISAEESGSQHYSVANYYLGCIYEGKQEFAKSLECYNKVDPDLCGHLEQNMKERIDNVSAKIPK